MPHLLAPPVPAPQSLPTRSTARSSALRSALQPSTCCRGRRRCAMATSSTPCRQQVACAAGRGTARPGGVPGSSCGSSGSHQLRTSAGAARRRPPHPCRPSPPPPAAAVAAPAAGQPPSYFFALAFENFFKAQHGVAALLQGPLSRLLSPDQVWHLLHRLPTMFGCVRALSGRGGGGGVLAGPGPTLPHAIRNRVIPGQVQCAALRLAG